LTDETSLLSGKNIFTVNCVPCHGPDGGGTVGPNLTDKYWIHGGSIKDVFKTVKYGVPVKGMISWQTMLNPKKIQFQLYSKSSRFKSTGGSPRKGICYNSTQTQRYNKNRHCKIKPDSVNGKK
jgi:hypothetical protein